jgi:hypothetical protein
MNGIATQTGKEKGRDDWFDRFPSTPIPAFPIKEKGDATKIERHVHSKTSARLFMSGAMMSG